MAVEKIDTSCLNTFLEEFFELVVEYETARGISSDTKSMDGVEPVIDDVILESTFEKDSSLRTLLTDTYLDLKKKGGAFDVIALVKICINKLEAHARALHLRKLTRMDYYERSKLESDNKLEFYEQLKIMLADPEFSGVGT